MNEAASVSNLKVNGPKDYASRQINPWRLEAIFKYAGHSVVDIGCGNGAYVLKLADQYDIYGVDYQEFDSWAAQRHRFVVGDASRLEIPDDSFDTVLSFETLEHLSDPVAALREYWRISRKNLILTVPNCELTPGLVRSNLVYSHFSDPTHLNFYTLPSLLNAVTDAGFVVRHSSLINPVNLGALVMESVGLRGRWAAIGRRAFRWVQRRNYLITCLVVADKI